MTHPDDQALDELMRLVGAAIDRQVDDLACTDESLLAWVAADIRAGMLARERAADLANADAFARNLRARLAIQRAERALPRRVLVRRSASMVGTVEQMRRTAMQERAVVMLDLAAAAGSGRELWDEPCDSWLTLPPDIPQSPYVALRVAGDSMTPVLDASDVILVKLDAPLSVDDLVVARLPDDGYVVKRVASVTRTMLTLASFNPEYPAMVVPRDRTTVLGTVIARFSRRN